MSILFFDTETTNKADLRRSPDGPHQPRVVQLAALLTDATGNQMGKLSIMIRPNGWTIPAEAAAIHGITTETAERYGVTMATAYEILSSLCCRAELLVAHNIEFDDFVITGECRRLHVPSFMPAIPRFCTMKASTDICKLPGNYGYKWPKLIEAHRIICGSDFEGAHDALADVEACARLYFKLKDINAIS